MNCSSYCRYELGLTRRILKEDNHKDIIAKIKGYYVDGPSKMSGSKKYYWVNDRDGNLLWEGIACCKYQAKINAIDRLLLREGA